MTAAISTLVTMGGEAMFWIGLIIGSALGALVASIGLLFYAGGAQPDREWR